MNSSKSLTPLMTRVVILSLASDLLAEGEQEKENQTKSSFPTLDILPEGSILQRVKLPRYDKDFNAISLLKADKLTVLSDQKIDGENISIELYNKDGTTQAHTDMRHAVYNQQTSSLHATQSIHIRGEGFQASGTGLIFNWKPTHHGFLSGPAFTEISLSQKKSPAAMQLPSTHSAMAITGAIISLSTSLIAEPPTPLTPKEISQLIHLSRSSAPVIKQNQANTTETIATETALQKKANASMKPFMESIGKGFLLVQNTSPSEQPNKPPTPAEKTSNQDAPAEKNSMLKIECEGGLYFDTDEGVLAYLKNVHLTEPRFTLFCTKELKVYLDQKSKPAADTDTPDKTAPATPDSKKAGEEAASNKTLGSSFGQLKRIIATGEVKLTSKDDKGNQFIATAEVASYDAQNEEMILHGGMPRIQYGRNQYLQSKAPGQSIRMLKNGKLVTEGKWTMEIDSSQTKTLNKKSSSTKSPQP